MVAGHRSSRRPSGSPSVWRRLRRRRRGGLQWATAVACLLLTGCGFGAGGAPAGVKLTITRDFGTAGADEPAAPAIGRRDSAIGLLERNGRVSRRFGAGEAIDGPGARGSVGWFYYVNGIEGLRRAVREPLHDGDRVWWDRHDSRATTAVPAVVGAFPEPFLHGTGGKRLPVRIECIDPQSPACDRVSRQLTGLGIPAARGGLGLAERNEALRVLVGTWPGLRTDAAARLLEAGPAASGVYARVAGDGRSIVLLDAGGVAVRTLGPHSGLVAATRIAGAPPVWIVTGTDEAGVAAAARAFEPGALHDRFALAVSNDLGVPLPAGVMAGA